MGKVLGWIAQGKLSSEIHPNKVEMIKKESQYRNIHLQKCDIIISETGFVKFNVKI